MHPVAIVVGSFVLMEPVTALTHRFVMHGVGKALHRSHHRNGAGSFHADHDHNDHGDDHNDHGDDHNYLSGTVEAGGAGTYGVHGFEANDAFPVMFAALVMIGLAVGFNVDGWSFLVPMGVGITAYGVSYALVHDVYIHRRVTLPAIGHRDLPGLRHLAAAHRVHHEGNGAPYGMLAPVIGWRSGSRPSQRPDDE